jgi:hypothetical protein
MKYSRAEVCTFSCRVFSANERGSSLAIEREVVDWVENGPGGQMKVHPRT